MTDKKYIRIPFANAYKGLAYIHEFDKVLDKAKEKLETLNIKRIWLNNVEVLDVNSAIECIRDMSVNQVIESEIRIELE